MDKEEFLKYFCEATDMKKNRFHPLVWISGEPQIGKNVYIGGMSEVYAKGAKVAIGDNCDIASFVVINCSDSHKKTIELNDEIEYGDIIIENNVYIGTQSYIGRNVHIGHHSVIGAGTIVRAGEYPPYSLIIGNPAIVKAGYYRNHKKATVNKSKSLKEF
jgi:acetyltransferase-like isoleucine patch superfamily enzyme